MSTNRGFPSVFSPHANRAYLLQSHPSQSHSILHFPSSQQQVPFSMQWHPLSQQQLSVFEHPMNVKEKAKINKVIMFLI